MVDHTLSWIFISAGLTETTFHRYNADMLLLSNTLSQFQANQYLLIILNVACLVEKYQIPIS